MKRKHPIRTTLFPCAMFSTLWTACAAFTPSPPLEPERISGYFHCPEVSYAEAFKNLNSVLPPQTWGPSQGRFGSQSLVCLENGQEIRTTWLVTELAGASSVAQPLPEARLRVARAEEGVRFRIMIREPNGGIPREGRIFHNRRRQLVDISHAHLNDAATKNELNVYRRLVCGGPDYF